MITTTQLVNVLLIALVIGFLSAHLAKKRGRNPLTWFAINFLFGLVGLAVLFILPKVEKKTAQRQPLKVALSQRSDAWLKLWYYLDTEHTSQGPLEFPDFIRKCRDQKITLHSYIWGEGMKEWSRLSELPEVIQEIERA